MISLLSLFLFSLMRVFFAALVPMSSFSLSHCNILTTRLPHLCFPPPMISSFMYHLDLRVLTFLNLISVHGVSPFLCFNSKFDCCYELLFIPCHDFLICLHPVLFVMDTHNSSLQVNHLSYDMLAFMRFFRFDLTKNSFLVLNLLIFCSSSLDSSVSSLANDSSGSSLAMHMGFFLIFFCLRPTSLS